MPYTGTVPYPLHAALTCANTSEDSSKGRDMGLWIDYYGHSNSNSVDLC